MTNWSNAEYGSFTSRAWRKLASAGLCFRVAAHRNEILLRERDALNGRRVSLLFPEPSQRGARPR